MKLERLNTKVHDRKSFDCGISSLNEYLHTKARKEQEIGYAEVYVLLLDNILAGYFTISPYALPLKNLEDLSKKKLPKYEMTPAALLGRLAIDLKFRNKGLGTFLLLKALGKALEKGGHLLVADALDEETAKFYLKYDFKPLPSKPLTLVITMDLVRSLRSQFDPQISVHD